MTDRDRLREAVARRIWDTWEAYGCTNRPWETASEARRHTSFLAADAALAAMVEHVRGMEAREPQPCPVCGGKGYQMVTDSRLRLVTANCSDCRGTGSRP